MTNEMHYRMYDSPDNGTVGVDCGVVPWSELPEWVRTAIDSDPTADEWHVATRDNDSGELLPGLTTIVSRVE